MLKKNDPFNVFGFPPQKPRKSEAVAKKAALPSPKKAEQPAPPPEKPKSSGVIPTPPDEQQTTLKPDIIELLKKMHQFHEDLDTKLSEVHAQAGLAPAEIKHYTSGLLAERVQKEVRELEQQIQKAIGKTIRIVTGAEKEKIKLTKTRKGKTLGSRKGWISIH